jgi:uncharacterized membrane protein
MAQARPYRRRSSDLSKIIAKWDAYHSPYATSLRRRLALLTCILFNLVFVGICYMLDPEKAKSVWWLFVVIMPAIIACFYLLSKKSDQK